MAYLGRNPAIGTQKVLDSLESQFNGVLTTFNLRYTSNVVYPTLPSSLIVSLGGVLQEPGTAYTVASDQITFAAAPNAGTDCWILLYSEFGAQAGATPSLTVANNVTVGGELHGPATFVIDPAVIGNNTGTVEIKGNLTVQGTTTTINSTTVDLDTLSLGDNEKISLGAGGVGDNGGTVESDLEIYSDGTNAYFDSGFIASTASPNIYFRTSATTTLDTNALTILNTGQVVIGDDASDHAGANHDDLVVGNSSAGKRSGITIVTATNQDGAICFSDGTGGSDHAKGKIAYMHDPSNASNEYLGFNVAGARRVTFDGDGNVGIGVDDPTSYGNSERTLVIEDDTNPAICISDTGQTRDWWLVGLSDGFSIRYADGGGASGASNVTSSAFFKNNGDAGIGTNTPQKKLHVSGTSDFVVDTSASGLRFGSYGEYDIALVTGRNTPTGSSRVYIENGNGEALRIDADNKVGIGTTDPVGNLEVRDTKANLIVAKDGLTVKSNSDLATQYDLIQLGAGGALASYSTATATADTQFIHNAYRHSGGNWKYRYADTAMRIRMNSPGNTFIFESAASGSADADITFSERLRIDSAGHVTPGGDDTQDLGSTSKRWRNIYTGDLQLSNEGSSNEVDGTWGNYTIQEGEEELFIINRRSGKKFKFVLEEVK